LHFPNHFRHLSRSKPATLAGGGCLAVDKYQIVRAWPPQVQEVDGCGAGATFSAGFIYGYLHGWGLEDSVRYAVVAASLKVACAGLQMAPVKEIQDLAQKIQVEVSSW